MQTNEPTFGGLPLSSIGETFGRFFESLAAIAPSSVDLKAPPVDVASHVARLEAERLYALLQSGELDELAQCDTLDKLCAELSQALPAIFPMRTQETYAALRDLLRSLHLVVLDVRRQLAREALRIGHLLAET